MSETLPPNPSVDVRTVRSYRLAVTVTGLAACLLVGCGSDAGERRGDHDASTNDDAAALMDSATPESDSGKDAATAAPLPDAAGNGGDLLDATLDAMQGDAPDATDPSDASASADASTVEDGGDSIDAAAPDASAPLLDCHTLRAFASDGSGPFPVGSGERRIEYRFEPVQSEAAYAVRISPLIDSRWVQEVQLYATDEVIAPGVHESSGTAPYAKLLYVWAPGGNALDLHALDPESGFELAAWTSFIMQIHYAGGHVKATDESGVELCTTTQARAKPVSISVLGTDLIAGSSRAQGTCDPAIPSPVRILALLQRMRSKGHSMRADILREDGSEEVLHDGSFMHAQQKWLSRDATLAQGDRVRVRCEYTGSVTFGTELTREVCYMYTLATPADVLRSGKLNHLYNGCLGTVADVTASW